MTDIELKILKIISGNPKITITTLSDKISKSPSTTKRYLKNLVDHQVIEREDGNRKGSWIILIDEWALKEIKEFVTCIFKSKDLK